MGRAFVPRFAEIGLWEHPVVKNRNSFDKGQPPTCYSVCVIRINAREKNKARKRDGRQANRKEGLQL